MHTLEETVAVRGVSTRPFDIREYISPLGSMVAGAANVIMQLSWPAVGYGVKESRVESGSAVKHPLKRSRTTFTYLAVAILGNDEDRQNFRRAVNRQHAQVRSTESSPVEYNAMDPRLQLWVAACLYYGLMDLTERTRGPLDDATADELYTYSARLGTTLQVPPQMWPPDRQAFAAYWEESLASVQIDDTIRRYLLDLVRLKNLPWIFQFLFARSNLFWTTGLLPPLFREQMRLAWTADDEARLARYLRGIGQIESVMPPAVKAMMFSILLADMRRRVRTGRPLV